MATTKKGTTGMKAGAGARKGATKANGVAKQTETKAKAVPAAKGAATTRNEKAAPVKINDRQRDFLTRIKGAGETGYEVGAKVEQRTIDALIERKLVKRGAKNKENGRARYLLTKVGEKHLPPPAPAPTEPAPAPASEPAPTV